MKTILKHKQILAALLFLFMAMQAQAQAADTINKSKRPYFLKRESRPARSTGSFLSKKPASAKFNPLAGIKRKAASRYEKLSLAASMEPIPFMGSANGISVKLRF